MRLFLLLPVFILLANCKNNNSTSNSRKEIEVMVDDFAASLGTRSENSHHSNTIFTEGGVFCISTQGGVIGDDGKLSLEGKSRVDGFYVAPRMIWVKNKEEAKKILLADLDSKAGYPVEDYSSTK